MTYLHLHILKQKISFPWCFFYRILIMATHSSILAWRIPGTEEPSGLPSMGLHRVRHDWSNLAAWILLVITGCYSITFEGSVKLICALCPCIRWLHIKWPPMRWLQTATPPGPFIFLLFLLSALPAFTLFPVCFLIFHLAGLLRISGWLYTISRVNCKGFPPTTTPWVFYLQCLFLFFFKLSSQFQMVEVDGSLTSN